MIRSLAIGATIVTVFTLFGLPKAGFYLGKVPVSLSYLLLGVIGCLELARIASDRGPKLRRAHAWLTLALAILAVIEFGAFRIYGARSMGAAVSIVTSTLVMPVLGMLAARWTLYQLGIDGLLKVMRWALVVVFAFGMVSFAVYNASGIVIGIPYVTATGSDVASVAIRHNLRGQFIKMFSTYHNGNILGVNLLLWGPLVALSGAYLATGYRMICVLTLSRSVWVGMVALEFIRAIAQQSYRRIYQAAGAAVVLAIIVVAASVAIGRDPAEFFFDRDLGGRVSKLQDDLEVISTSRIGWDNESVPAAAWLAFGPMGMVIIGVIWFIPIVTGGTTIVQITARISLLAYTIVAVAEGAFNLVPTQAVYWFVAGIAMAPAESVAWSPSVQPARQLRRRSAKEAIPARGPVGCHP